MTAPQGLGVFLWLPHKCEDGNLDAIVAKAKPCGVRWLAMQNFCSAPWVARFKAEGLWVAFSGYCVPGAAETAAFIAGAKAARAAGVDGIFVDAETEWEKLNGQVADRSAEALAFAKALRNVVGQDCFIGDAGAWAEPKFHPTYPDAAFGAIFDAALPERYWTQFPPAVPYAKSITETETEWGDATGFGPGTVGARYGGHVLPIGSGYGTNTPVPGGHQALQAADFVNFLGRYPTSGLWSWLHLPSWAWDAMKLVAQPAPYTTPIATNPPSAPIDLTVDPEDTIPPI